MSDLISRKALIEALEKEEKIYKDNKTYPSFYTAKAVTRHQPSVEAVPVVHGEWIKTFKSMVQNLNTGELEPKYSYDCSICKWHTGNQGTRFNFCPNCGADMRSSAK